MISVEELRAENNEIKDLSEVLSNLVAQASLQTNAVFCELLERFQNKLDEHLKHEARSIYPELLNHDDKNIKQTARDFISNTHELERILSKYTKRWCKHVNKEKHEEFKNETMAVFNLINERIQMEEAHLFTVL
ncbi:MAG: hemerythrin domain-containing protein [Gammaproteobacteria bacterium]|nr:hemerythrin domain-containing protein [Gammaproteobacteria bacterium]MCW8923751.1 hemerythrin domain-containing protein [Gammaproteobacteria bacterium]